VYPGEGAGGAHPSQPKVPFFVEECNFQTKIFLQALVHYTKTKFSPEKALVHCTKPKIFPRKNPAFFATIGKM
jgi:hypothetical protein